MSFTQVDNLTTGTRMRPFGRLVAMLAFVSWSAVACAQANTSKPAEGAASITDEGDAGTIAENPSAPTGEIPPETPAQPAAQLQLGSLAYGGKACAVPEGVETVVNTGS